MSQVLQEPILCYGLDSVHVLIMCFIPFSMFIFVRFQRPIFCVPALETQTLCC